MNTMHNTAIPFVGFYETIIGEYISEHQTANDIAQEWVNAVSNVIGNRWGKHTIQFDKLVSPKFYNFETDRIFANLDTETIAKMAVMHRETLEHIARELLTDRDGFTSFYSPDLMDWGAIKDWDHNQCGLALQAFLMDELGNDWEWILEERVTENLHNPEWEDELE